MEKEVLKALGGGLGIAGKLMGRGVDEVRQAMAKSEDSKDQLHTGLHYNVSEGDFRARVSLFEPQNPSRLNVGVLRNLTMSGGERDFLQGLEALLNGCHSEALEHFKDATKRGDSKVSLTDAYYVLGCLQCQLGDYPEASRQFKTALMAQQGLAKQIKKWCPSLHLSVPLTANSSFFFCPDLIGVTLLMAYTQSYQNPAEALHTLEQLLEILENEPAALFFVGLYRYRQKDYRGVFSALQRTLPDSNLQVASMLLLGKACQQLGDPLTAQEIFQKAQQRQDLDFTLQMDLRSSLADAKEAAGKAQEAFKERQAVAKLAPHYVSAEIRWTLSAGATAAPVAATPEVTPASPKTRELKRDYVPVEPVQLIDPSGGMTRLVCLDRQLDLNLGPTPVVIGRDEGDVQLGEDTAVSRRHTQITFENGLFWIEDLESTNGTWVNRHRIRRKVELHRGDVIEIGENRFEIQ